MVGPPEEEVDLHVHQPGKERHVLQVDLDGTLGHRRGIDLDDAVTGDEEVARGHHLAGRHVEHAGTAQVGVFGGAGTGHRVLLQRARK